MTKTSKGKIAQLLFLQAVLAKDIRVAIPFAEQSGWDALILLPDGWKSVQVKTAYRRNGRGGQYVDVLKGGGTGKTTTQRRYKPGDFDFLAAVDLDTKEVWLITASIALGRRCLTLQNDWLI